MLTTLRKAHGRNVTHTAFREPLMVWKGSPGRPGPDFRAGDRVCFLAQLDQGPNHPPVLSGSLATVVQWRGHGHAQVQLDADQRLVNVFWRRLEHLKDPAAPEGEA